MPARAAAGANAPAVQDGSDRHEAEPAGIPQFRNDRTHARGKAVSLLVLPLSPGGSRVHKIGRVPQLGACGFLGREGGSGPFRD